MSKRVFLRTPDGVDPEVAAKVINLLINEGRLEKESDARFPLRWALSSDAKKRRPYENRILLGYEDWE
jgi:hypothetical protein